MDEVRGHTEPDARVSAGEVSVVDATEMDVSRRKAPAAARGPKIWDGPRRFGRYTVLEKLGAGGMGVVYAAYDPELDRRVAIKLLLDGGEDTDGDEERARLIREAKAMARLSHSNVVTVHDVGTTEGTVFVAMEYVAGGTLKAWMRAHDRPTVDEVLTIFTAAGRGLAAAHDAGLVHRDFKPDNVMLAEGGVAKVMDFGLARLVGAARQREAVEGAEFGTESLEKTLTSRGAVMGTPAYMAPEQFAGDTVDGRADQFAFCVALHEALYGIRPFAGRSARALMQAVLTGKVRSPPRDRRVPAWLRAAILRGLEIDKADRWPSMHALLESLANTPARRRQRRARVATVGGVLVTGAAAVYAASGGGPRDPCGGASERLQGVWDDARRGEVTAALEGTGMAYAKVTATAVTKALDRYTEAWRTEYREACEATAVRKEQSPEVLDLRMSCLSARRRELRSLVDVYAEADAAVVERAVQAAGALHPVTRCADLEYLRQRVKPPVDKAVAARVDDVRERLARARALKAAGKYELAARLLGELAIDAKTLAHGPLTAEHAALQGEVHERRGRYKEAEQRLREAFFVAREYDHHDVSAETSISLTMVVGERLGRYEDGLEWGKHARAEVQRRGTELQRATVFNNLGAILFRLGRHDEALDHMKRALELRQQVLGPDSVQAAMAMSNVGGALIGLGRFEQAEPVLREAREILQRELGADHPKLTSILENLARSMKDSGRYDEAEEVLRRAQAIAEASLGADNPKLGRVLSNLGSVLIIRGELDEGARLMRRALQIQEAALGVEHPSTAPLRINLATVAHDKGDHKQELEHLEMAASIRRAAFGEDHVAVARVLSQIGSTRDICLRDHAGAESLLRTALATQSEQLPPDHPDLAITQLSLAEALIHLGRVQEALDLTTTVMAGVSKLEPVDKATTLWLRAQARDALAQDREGALADARRAAALFRGAGSEQQAATVDGWISARVAGGAGTLQP